MTRVSVIVPTYNRPAELSLCLQALARQDCPRDQYEIIVVDDGGSSSLDEVVAPLRSSVSIHVIQQPNSGPARARNVGAAQARSEFIVFTDDDCVPESGWLSAMIYHLLRDPSRLYGGRTVNGLTQNVYSSASQALIDYLYGYYNGDPNKARFVTSSNIAMSRALFESVGGFDVSFPRASGEDRDLCDRWLQLGRRLTYVPEARVLHRHELGFRSFWRQHYHYGEGAWRFHECRRMRGLSGPSVEPLWFYVNLVRHAWRKGLHRPFSLTLLLVLSQAANAAGFIGAALHKRA